MNTAIEILSADENAYATVFPAYNKVYDGCYLKSWEDVLQRLEKPVLLDINVEEYKKLKEKDAKTALTLKFKAGGYDAGPCPLVKSLKDGSVKPCRASGVPKPNKYSFIVLDADGPKDGVLDNDFDNKLNNLLKKYTYYSHATISSTKEKKKRRILIPLQKPCTADEREAVIRFIANEVGIDNVDKASTHTKQLMCFPVHVKDGDNYHYYNDVNNLMDAVEWLNNNYPDWRNVETQPKWPNETKVKTNKISNKTKDIAVESGVWCPVYDKNKIHNAYNNTYRISDVLTKSGKYKQESATRWSHTYDDSINGIQVTNDAILFSHYGTDVLSVGSVLDAYETAIILTYGSLEKENWQRMLVEASNDNNVRKTMVNSVVNELPPDAETWQVLYDSTEEGIAKRCLAYFPHKVRNGKWWRYSNGIYTQVSDAAMLPDVLQMLRIASALQPDDENINYMVGRKTSAHNILNLWFGYASQQEVHSELWENHAWYLHFTDCVVDLEAWCKGENYKLKHSPDMLLTQSVGYAWQDVENVDSKAMNEVITNLETYLPDEQLRDYFQRAVGRALTATACTEDKCIWMLSAKFGVDGGNGKSTILAAIQGALGGEDNTSYYYNMKGKYLYYSSKDRDAESPSPELSSMRDRRFVNFTEYNGIRTLDSEKYKNYTSAGFINARRLHSNADNFRAKCCCYIDCNGMPGLQKKENAILRRTRVVPFEAELDGDRSIKNRWLTDHNIHVAMLCWLMLGLKSWYDNGQKLDGKIDRDETIPQQVFFQTMSWINSFDSPMDFFDDFYEVTNNDDDYLIGEDCYKTYAEQVYDKGATAHAFRREEEQWLRAHGITRKAKRPVNDYGLRRMCYIGVRLIGTFESTRPTYGKYNHIQEVKKNA